MDNSKLKKIISVFLILLTLTFAFIPRKSYANPLAIIGAAKAVEIVLAASAALGAAYTYYHLSQHEDQYLKQAVLSTAAQCEAKNIKAVYDLGNAVAPSHIIHNTHAFAPVFAIAQYYLRKEFFDKVDAENASNLKKSKERVFDRSYEMSNPDATYDEYIETILSRESQDYSLTYKATCDLYGLDSKSFDTLVNKVVDTCPRSECVKYSYDVPYLNMSYFSDYNNFYLVSLALNYSGTCTANSLYQGELKDCLIVIPVIYDAYIKLSEGDRTHGGIYYKTKPYWSAETNKEYQDNYYYRPLYIHLESKTDFLKYILVNGVLVSFTKSLDLTPYFGSLKAFESLSSSTATDYDDIGKAGLSVATFPYTVPYSYPDVSTVSYPSSLSIPDAKLSNLSKDFTYADVNLTPLVEANPSIASSTDLSVEATDNPPVTEEKDGILTKILDLIKAIPDLLNQILQAIKTVISEISHLSLRIADAIKSAISTVSIEKLLQSIHDRLETLPTSFSDAIDSFKGDLQSLQRTLQDFVHGLPTDLHIDFGPLKEKLGTIQQSISDFMTTFPTTLSESMQKALSGVGELLQSMSTSLSNLKTGVSERIGTLQQALQGHLETIGTKLGELSSSLAGTISGALTGVISAVQAIPATLSEAISTAFSTALSGVTSIAQSILDFLKSMFDPKDFSLDLSKLKLTSLKTVFPFCIPFDIYTAIALFSSGASFTPTLHISTQYFTIDQPIDLGSISGILGFVKAGELIFFCIMLFMITKRVMKW